MPNNRIKAGEVEVVTDERGRPLGFSTPSQDDDSFFSRVLASSGVQVSHTGNTTETVVGRAVIPGGAMGPNGQLRVTSLWSNNNSAGAKNLRIRLGGIAGTPFMAVAPTTTLSLQHQVLIRNRNNQQAQVGMNSGLSGALGTSGSNVTTGAQDTTKDIELLFTIQLASGADNAALEAYLVELLPSA